MKQLTPTLFLSVLLLSPLPLLAQQAAPATPAQPVAAAASAPEQAPQSSVKTFSGGIAEEGMQKVSEIEKDYTLKLVFSDKEGAYLADVNVSIKDKAGKELVHETTSGPVLLAALPKGQYTIEASVDGTQQKLKATVADKKLLTLEVHMPMVSP